MEITYAISRDDAIALLLAQQLPVSDLPLPLQNFVAATHQSKTVGLAGLQIYGSYGLLRSVAVSDDVKGTGIGRQLVTAIESMAAAKNLTEIYLLTQTAAKYFAAKGYQIISRDAVPPAVKASTEFSHICPSSAIVMKKIL